MRIQGDQRFQLENLRFNSPSFAAPSLIAPRSADPVSAALDFWLRQHAAHDTMNAQDSTQFTLAVYDAVSRGGLFPFLREKAAAVGVELDEARLVEARDLPFHKYFLHLKYRLPDEDPRARNIALVDTEVDAGRFLASAVRPRRAVPVGDVPTREIAVLLQDCCSGDSRVHEAAIRDIACLELASVRNSCPAWAAPVMLERDREVARQLTAELMKFFGAARVRFDSPLGQGVVPVHQYYDVQSAEQEVERVGRLQSPTDFLEHFGRYRRLLQAAQRGLAQLRAESTGPRRNVDRYIEDQEPKITRQVVRFNQALAYFAVDAGQQPYNQPVEQLYAERQPVRLGAAALATALQAILIEWASDGSDRFGRPLADEEKLSILGSVAPKAGDRISRRLLFAPLSNPVYEGLYTGVIPPMGSPADDDENLLRFHDFLGLKNLEGHITAALEGDPTAADLAGLADAIDFGVDYLNRAIVDPKVPLGLKSIIELNSPCLSYLNYLIAVREGAIDDLRPNLEAAREFARANLRFLGAIEGDYMTAIRYGESASLLTTTLTADPEPLPFPGPPVVRSRAWYAVEGIIAAILTKGRVAEAEYGAAADRLCDDAVLPALVEHAFANARRGVFGDPTERRSQFNNLEGAPLTGGQLKRLALLEKAYREKRASLAPAPKPKRLPDRRHEETPRAGAQSPAAAEEPAELAVTTVVFAPTLLGEFLTRLGHPPDCIRALLQEHPHLGKLPPEALTQERELRLGIFVDVIGAERVPELLHRCPALWEAVLEGRLDRSELLKLSSVLEELLSDEAKISLRHVRPVSWNRSETAVNPNPRPARDPADASDPRVDEFIRTLDDPVMVVRLWTLPGRSGLAEALMIFEDLRLAGDEIRDLLDARPALMMPAAPGSRSVLELYLDDWVPSLRSVGLTETEDHRRIMKDNPDSIHGDIQRIVEGHRAVWEEHGLAAHDLGQSVLHCKRLLNTEPAFLRTKLLILQGKLEQIGFRVPAAGLLSDAPTAVLDGLNGRADILLRSAREVVDASPHAEVLPELSAKLLQQLFSLNPSVVSACREAFIAEQRQRSEYSAGPIGDSLSDELRIFIALAKETQRQFLEENRVHGRNVLSILAAMERGRIAPAPHLARVYSEVRRVVPASRKDIPQQAIFV